MSRADPQLPSYRIQGSGDALVYLPGLDGTGELFYRQIPELAARYRVITTSYREDPHATIEDILGDVEALLSVEAGSSRVTLLGESFGGAMALAFAARRPDRVSQLIVVNSSARFRERFPMGLASAVVRRLPYSLFRLMRRVGARFLLLNGQIGRDDGHEFHRRVAGHDLASYANRLKILNELDLREELPRISCPVLLLAGGTDRLIPATRYAGEMAAMIPRARLLLLPGVGHLALLDRRVSVAKILEEVAETSQPG